MNKKPIIILLITALLLISAIYILNANRPVENTDTKQEEEQKTYIVYDAGEKNVTKIEITLPDSSFSFEKDQYGTFKCVEIPSAVLDRNKISYLESQIRLMYAEEESTKDAYNLSDYGFDTPKVIIKGIFDDDSSVTYRLGNLTQNQGHFINVEDSKEVYVVYTDRSRSFMQSLKHYRDTNILYDTDVNFLSTITFDTAEGRIHLLKDNSQGQSDTWMMKSPIERSANSQSITDNIAQKLAALYIDDFVEDDVKDFSKYGLGKNARILSFEDDFGNGRTLFIGNKHSDDKMYYVQLEGSRSVVSVSCDTLSFMEMNIFSFAESLVNLQVLSDVEKVEYIKGDSVQTMHITRENDSKKESENNAQYYINNVHVSSETFKKIYMNIIGIDIRFLTDTPPTGEPEYKIVYHMTDGSVTTIEFVRQTDRYYAAFKDGECQHIVLKDKLENIYNSLNAIR